MSDNFYLFKRFFQAGNLKHIYEPGDRTPYPIIVENPSFRDIIYNMELPEWTPFLVSLPVGSFFGYKFTFQMAAYPLSRRRGFAGVLGLFMLTGFYIGIKGSYYKLVGFENNGLRWERTEQRVKKYDFTSDFHGFWEDMIRSETWENQ